MSDMKKYREELVLEIRKILACSDEEREKLYGRITWKLLIEAYLTVTEKL